MMSILMCVLVIKGVGLSVYVFGLHIGLWPLMAINVIKYRYIIIGSALCTDVESLLNKIFNG